ncbi:MAG: SRPBCC family protein, partial [Proteobacteria bacterium]|nr:SRPBCC family protein [Pseudomonadota bacterium]
MILRFTVSAITSILLSFAHSAYSADPPELSVRHTIEINAPTEKVWDIVSDFGGLHHWLFFIKDTQIILGKNRELGAIRLLTRGNGTKIEERLVEYDPYNMIISYTYAQGVPISSDYYSTITVT